MFLVELNNIYVRLRTHISNWTTYQFIIKKLNTPFGFLLFLLLALGVAFILSQFNAKIGLILFILSIGIGVILICIYKLELSFFIAILLSPLFYVTSKYFLQVVPIGVAIDGLLFWGLLLILVHQISLRSRQWTFMINPISLSIVVYLLYIFVQGFNPNLDSIESYFSVNRRLFSYLSGYLIVSYCFTSIAFLKRFIGFWLIFGFLTGLYGCYQEWFGLLDFEYRWINAVESAFNLIYIDGRFRVFSFHVGPASFGTFMAMTSIFCFILALGPFKKWHRLIFFIVGIITTLGIVYSGTRTANAMLIGGLFLYILMTINNKKTLLFATLVSGLMVVLVLGPFYGNPVINRLRSTFEGKEDLSMNVRNINRAYIQPYIYEHALGGGMGTSGSAGMKDSPTHDLAGFPPDSGYLKVAIEMGWIGLIIFAGFCLIFMITSVRNYYRMKDPKLKSYAIGITCSLFGIVIGLYPQEGIIELLPEGLFFWALLAITGNLQRVVNENIL